MLRAKGIERSILVSDAVSAADTRPGRYSFAGMEIEHSTDGSVRLPSSRYLAGSALTLDKAVSNVVRWNLASPEEAIRMACDNPRALMAPAFEAHGLTAPMAGNVTWSEDWEVQEIEFEGVVHYRR
jgi:N-acetylglucosamine-6-phosphate deacetylase